MRSLSRSRAIARAGVPGMTVATSVSAPRPPVLAVVLSHPTQYYSPWFRWLAAHTTLRLHVFYLWKFGVTATHDPRFQTTFRWDVDLLGGYEHEFVPNRSRSPGAESFWGFDNPLLPARLAALRPDAILIFGYNWATHLRTILWARLHRVPIVFRGDSHLLGRPFPGLLRRLLLQTLFRQFSAVTFVGAANRHYFNVLGVPAARLFFAPHAVNHELFDPADSTHLTAARALRAQLGISPTARVVLFAGKFVGNKQPRELLAAFLAIHPQHPSSVLVFVGDGEERAALVALAAHAAPGAVHFLPFANQSEMPARYRLADIFALPSRGHYETWGLAVNEAMHLGLPCLVSDRVGCQADLVSDGDTGWVFPAEDYSALRAKLGDALSADLPSFRARVALRIAGYTYTQASAGLLQAVTSVCPPSVRT